MAQICPWVCPFPGCAINQEARGAYRGREFVLEYALFLVAPQIKKQEGHTGDEKLSVGMPFS